MSLIFPFVYSDIPSLGRLFYPFINASLKTIYGWQEFDFLVDTGADVTTFPKAVLKLLELNKKDLWKQKTQGVGGIWVATFECLLLIRIGSEEFTIHASITDTEEEGLPFLLGRKDIFEKRFSLEIDSQRKVTIIRKNT